MNSADIAVVEANGAGQAPVDFFEYGPASIRVSSRGLGWSVIDFQRRDSAPAVRELPNGSRQHLLFVCLSGGRITRESNGERVEHETAPGFVTLLPARTPIRWSWKTRISCSVIALEPAFVDKVAEQVFGLSPEHYRFGLTERGADPAVNNIAGVLSREVVRAEPGSKLYAESLANILAVHLLRHYAVCAADGRDLQACSMSEEADAEPAEAPTTQPRAVKQALEFIHANYTSDVSLNEIAKAASLSPFHLARLFKQSLGVSPHQYLIQLRVNSARSLLSAGSGERSLAELASAVGFADQSHLTRHFKRIVGVTPRQFRA
jgi:AraC family transcriptional regulator